VTPVLLLLLLLQATLSGLLTAGMFYFISAAKPLEELSATRPHPSIFCVYFFASLLGQFAMHLTFLIVMYRSVEHFGVGCAGRGGAGGGTCHALGRWSCTSQFSL
jgi:hypothetical protein